MSKTVKLASLSAAIVLTMGLLDGCSSGRPTREIALEALSKANEAKMCCEMKTESTSRMFEKAMAK